MQLTIGDLRDLRDLLAQRQWKPIEGAPREGGAEAKILLWHPWYTDQYFLAHWVGDGWMGGPGYYWPERDMDGAKWQPLPTLPEPPT